MTGTIRQSFIFPAPCSSTDNPLSNVFEEDHRYLPVICLLGAPSTEVDDSNSMLPIGPASSTQIGSHTFDSLPAFTESEPTYEILYSVELQFVLCFFRLRHPDVVEFCVLTAFNLRDNDVYNSRLLDGFKLIMTCELEISNLAGERKPDGDNIELRALRNGAGDRLVNDQIFDTEVPVEPKVPADEILGRLSQVAGRP